MPERCIGLLELEALYQESLNEQADYIAHLEAEIQNMFEEFQRLNRINADLKRQLGEARQNSWDEAHASHLVDTIYEQPSTATEGVDFTDDSRDEDVERSDESTVNEAFERTPEPEEAPAQNPVFKLRRSVSESKLLHMSESSDESEPEVPLKKATFTPHPWRGIARSVTDMRHSERSQRAPIPATSTVESVQDIRNKTHAFQPKRHFLRDACDVCGRMFRFRSNAVKCTCCRLTCHDDCRESAVLPCVARMTSVTSRGARPRLVDFCPPVSPMIPHIVIHLVIAMDDNCLFVRSLYNNRGVHNEREVSNLLHQLKVRRSPPQMSSITGFVLSSCLKKFLLELKDPLIPFSSAEEFAKARRNEAVLKQVIQELPIPNQETLQFLCLHWQRVIANSHVNRMTTKEMAKSLAPAVFGPAHPPTGSLVEAMQALLELKGWRELVTYDHGRGRRLL
ncbi:hypothetical protein L596_007625 [Steinernema carpocapsae]|uniref:Rho-GAP domain-containing protein n=1 Tax=Steinernema carpocapsae TaxID=34508 RepID=A0A4V6A621_STECR|nr:hypothetical protein L596_007625 [Steinernema carpocapsae]